MRLFITQEWFSLIEYNMRWVCVCVCAGEMGRSSGLVGSKRITEAEALRAMQRLCQKVATQKMLVISSLENDCSKEELNHQIAVSGPI